VVEKWLINYFFHQLFNYSYGISVKMVMHHCLKAIKAVNFIRGPCQMGGRGPKIWSYATLVPSRFHQLIGTGRTRKKTCPIIIHSQRSWQTVWSEELLVVARRDCWQSTALFAAFIQH